MNLRTLSSKTNLKGKRVLLRVDWNVPVRQTIAEEDAMKIERSIATLKMLTRRGATVIVLTHFGRPDGRDLKFSTRSLAEYVRATYGLSVVFHPEAVEDVTVTGPGIHLLENVRFESGEEKNDVRLARAYAKLGDIFVNDAFASCHRRHASVVGIAKFLPSFAGPQVVAEVAALSKLMEKPKHPFVAVIGGLKVSTKIDVLKVLLKSCDQILIGGAMATTFWAAEGRMVGASFVEREAFAEAAMLAKNKKIILPSDVVRSKNKIEDIGADTLRDWSTILSRARTIVWNGPVGVVEQAAFAKGSHALAKLIAAQSDHAFTVAGGGDTLPILLETHTVKKFLFVSMGGGAMLEFIAKKGKLSGLVVLAKKE